SSQVKLDYARARLAFARAQLTNTISSLNDAVSGLEQLTGPLPEFTAAYPAYPPVDRYTLQDYINMAKEHNNALRLNRSDIRALEHQMLSEKAGGAPALRFQIEAENDYD